MNNQFLLNKIKIKSNSFHNKFPKTFITLKILVEKLLNLSLENSKDKLLTIINNNLIITLSCFNNLKVDQVEARAKIIKDKE
jgi:hypothetical protein